MTTGIKFTFAVSSADAVLADVDSRAEFTRETIRAFGCPESSDYTIGIDPEKNNAVKVCFYLLLFYKENA